MELRGNLKDFSLPDIIQLVGFGRKTGVLQIACNGGEAALYFDQGQVVHAEHQGKEGEPAVYALFRVPEGEFRFRSADPPSRRTITLDPTNLVMEAARLHDESRRDEDVPGTSEAEDETGDWLEFQRESRDPREIKQDIQSLLKRRFGRDAKRLTQAVDRCGDSVEDLLELADRVEKYVRVFVDERASHAVGQEIRDLISGPASS